MGTKVQCKSFLPRYYPMRDLNEEASSNWSPFYDVTAFSRQLFNDVKLGFVNGYSEYDREMLKRTMLEHEAVFRKQVYELHRLYRKQKDLMDECRSKQFYRLCRTTETSKSSTFSAQVPSEAGETGWHASTPSPISSHCKVANVSDAMDNRGTIKFLKEASMQDNPSADNGRHMKNYELIQTEAKRSRRIIDLHLPADAYIDIEYTGADTENSKPCFIDVDPLNSVSFQHDSDFKLTLGTDEVHRFRQDDYKAGIGPRTGFPLRGLTDLNEPVEDLCDEGGAGSGSFISNALKIQSEDIIVNQTPRTPNVGFLANKFLMRRDTEEGTFLSHMNADKGERKPEWPSLHDSVWRDRNITGSLNSGHFTMEYPMSSESIQLRLKKPERQLCDSNNGVPWFGERTADPTNIYKSPHLLNSRYLTTQATKATSIAASSPCPTTMSVADASGKQPTKNISHLQIAFQALPSFGGSVVMNEQSRSKITAVQDERFICDKLLRNGDLLPHIRTAHENCGSSGPRKCLKGLLCSDVKSAKDVKLKAGATHENKYGFIARKEFTSKQDDLKGVLCHNKPPCSGVANLNLCGSRVDSEFFKNHCQVISSFSKVNNDFPMEELSYKNAFLCDLQNSLSSFKVENKVQKKGTPEILSKGRTQGFPESFNCFTSSLHSEQTLADNQKYSQKGENILKSSLGIRCEINLNSPVEEEEISLNYLPNNISSLTCQIDLEAPANELEDIRCSTGKLKSDQLVKTIDLSKDNVHSNDSPQEAASTIVSMSMDSRNILGGTMPNLLPPVSCDSLSWFAEVITSNCEAMENHSGRKYGGSEASDRLDLFEYMTLKLDEVKKDEHWHPPYYYQHEEPNDEAKCTAYLLFTRPRRGQARRRRQKKDFQNDVLSTIASLSRQEVTEDIQALGGPTKTSSRKRNNGSSSRSTARSGLKCPARGRRPRSMAAATVAEVSADPPPLQPTQNELGNDVSIKGWGRTTRRCRRQRMPAMAIPAPQA